MNAVTPPTQVKRGRPRGSKTLRSRSWQDANPHGFQRRDSFVLTEHVQFMHSVLMDKNGTKPKDTGLVLTHKKIKKLRDKRGGYKLKHRSDASITRTLTEMADCGVIFRTQASKYDPKTGRRTYGPNVLYPGSCGKKELQERYDRLIREDLEKKGLRNKAKAARKEQPTPRPARPALQPAHAAQASTHQEEARQEREAEDERRFYAEYAGVKPDPAMKRQLETLLKRQIE